MAFHPVRTAFFFLMVQFLYDDTGAQTCHNVITLTQSEPNTTIYMPNYYDRGFPPTPYTCTWQLPAPAGYKVRLTLRDVDTTMRETLTVYSRESTRGTYTMALTGALNYPIAPLISQTAGLSLKYTNAARRRDGRGFLADVSLTEEMQNAGPGSCGGKIVLSKKEPVVDIRAPYSSSGVTVPLSPKPYGQASCRWVVEAPRRKRVKITWNKVDTKNEAILVYDRRAMQSGSRAIKLKGQVNWGLAPFISSTNAILFSLEREGALEVGNGFHVTVEMTNEAVVPYSCGGTYFLDESQMPTLNISSPYYNEPETSGSIISCWWYLNAPAGKQIRLEIQDTHTTPFETLKIYDGRSDATKIPLEFLYGEEGPHLLVSTEGGMLVSLEDRRMFGRNGRGFTLTASISDDFSWNLNETHPSCGQVVYLDHEQPRYEFSSLQFPSTASNIGYSCFWTFHSPPDTQLVLDLPHVHLISQSFGVEQDGIQLLGMENIPFPVANRLQTGNNQSQVLFSGGEYSNLLQGGFVAEMTFVPRGFTNWTFGEIFTECGGVINLSEDLPTWTIITPDYPLLTGGIHSCAWVIRAPAGSNVDVTFCDLSINAPGSVSVFDGPNLRRMMFQKSGSEVPSPVTTTNNVAIVRYESRGRTVGRGAKFVVRDSSFKSNIDPCTLEETAEEVSSTPYVTDRRTVSDIQQPSEDDIPTHSASGVTVVCDSTHMTVYLNRSLFAPNISPSTLSFKDESCFAFHHDSDHVALSTRYDKCKTQREDNQDYIIYSNTVEYTRAIPIPGTWITRDRKQIVIQTRCQLNRRQTLSSLPTNVGEDANEISETGYGNFLLDLQRFTDSSFTQPQNETSSVVPNQRLFYAVNLTIDPGFVFYIDNCWATPTPDPLDEQQQNLISSGCEADQTLTIYTNFSSSLQPFSFEASTLSTGSEQVYVHCEAVICYENTVDSRCSRGCLKSNPNRGRREVNRVDINQGLSSIPHVVSRGPLYLTRSDKVPSAGEGHRSEVSGMDGLKQTLISVLCVVLGLVIVIVVIHQIKRR